MVRKILVPVDGSAHAERAVAYVIDIATRGDKPEVHLLNVQTPISSGQVRLFLSKESIEEYYRMEGETALASARAAIEKSGLPYRAVVEVGHAAEAIADYCKTNGCDAVVMGTRGMGSMSNLVMGSVANKVIHLVDVPVTLIK
jgi:nucleotide-binding universal stress UspA family protein